MLKATKKNRTLRIPDAKRKQYEALGYTITTMDGNIVFEPENKDKTIAALKAEIDELKAKIATQEADGVSNNVQEQTACATAKKCGKKADKETAE